MLNRMIRVLFIGDIVGKSGRTALSERLPFLKQKYQYDLLIINGENSAHGKGITRKIYDSFIDLGADCVTLGNHAFSKSMVMDFIEDADSLIRPYNMEPLNIGKPCKIIDWQGYKIGIYNIYGNIFMDNATSSPFYAMEALLKKYPSDIRIVDIHAETTGEKYTFMQYFRDEIQMIVGTHTHIQTADEQIMGKCAFISDVGMTGAYDSVLGRDTDEVIHRMVYLENTRYTISENPAMLCGVCVDIDLERKQAVHIERIQLRPGD